MSMFLSYILLITNLLVGSPPLYKEYEVLDSSKIQIKGTSNVAGFRCNCNMKTLDPIYVKYELGQETQRFSTMDFPVNNFNCGAKAINKDFMDLVQAKEHPNLKLRLLSVKPINNEKVRVNIEVTIAGKTNKYSTVVAYKRMSDHLQTNGKFGLDIEDFGLEQPKKLMGLIVINKEIDILFNLHFRSIV